MKEERMKKKELKKKELKKKWVQFMKALKKMEFTLVCHMKQKN